MEINKEPYIKEVQSLYKLCLFSNNNVFSILVHDKKQNEYFCFNATMNDLLQINTNFAQFSTINSFHKSLVNFIDSNNKNILFFKSETILNFQCKNFFETYNLTLPLFPSYFETRTLTIMENKTTITNHKLNRAKKINIQSNCHSKFYPSLINYFLQAPSFWINFNLLISLILLISTSFLCYFYLNENNFFPQSNIAQVNDMKLISKWINPNTSFNFSLLYKGSKDGDSAYSFHRKCDKAEGTVTLISTQEGWKFGGYTDSFWEDPNSEDFYTSVIIPTENTFIFSLTFKKKYHSEKKDPPITCKYSSGPTFGLGPDIEIVSNFFSNYSSCNSPNTFGNMDKINEFNGGKKHFLVKEIEVFSVNKN